MLLFLKVKLIYRDRDNNSNCGGHYDGSSHCGGHYDGSSHCGGHYDGSSHCGGHYDGSSHCGGDDCGDSSHPSGYSKVCTYSVYNTYIVLFIQYTNKIIFCKF